MRAVRSDGTIMQVSHTDANFFPFAPVIPITEQPTARAVITAAITLPDVPLVADCQKAILGPRKRLYLPGEDPLEAIIVGHSG
jgi:hypothetical protein